MESKSTWIGMTIGSVIGGYMPSLWGAGTFSILSIMFSAVGAILGIWFVFKMSN